MLLKFFDCSEGVFKPDFRRQLLASLSVTIIVLTHGIALGWLSPMLAKLQSKEQTPLNFVVDVDQASWVGSLISVGGVTGMILFGILVDKIGRKACIYIIAFPNMCLWLTFYFANSVEYLYIGRVFGGITGGGIYVVIPIFISEIADNTIRGRLTSLFTLLINTGILLGFIISSHLPYHLIPCLVIVLPVLYLILATLLPETPQQLLRFGRDEQAKESFKFYRNFNSTTKEDFHKFNADFAELRTAVTQQKSENGNLVWKDFYNKRALKALCTGIVLMVINIYCGHFAFINYMSTIFAAMKSKIDPDTNTIIIGVIQILGTYTATVLVDQFGRKILMLFSTAAVAVGTAALGTYAFFAEETDADLNSYSAWLPVLLMAFTVFSASVGLISVVFVVLIEIMPPKIRSKVYSFCLTLLSVFAFGLLKGFPISMHVFGLSATMWFCSCICAFGLFYISVFLEETKGKSIDKDED